MKGDILSPDEFLDAVRDGRRGFEGAIIRGSLTIEDTAFDPPLDLSGITIEGDLTLRCLTGCRISHIRARGTVVIQNVQ